MKVTLKANSQVEAMEGQRRGREKTQEEQVRYSRSLAARDIINLDIGRFMFACLEGILLRGNSV